MTYPDADEVTHGFTLKSPWLTAAMLTGAKQVENRSQVWKQGWYAVHTGVGTKGDEWAKEHVRQNATAAEWEQIQACVEAGNRVPRGHIAGLCYIKHALPEDCVVDEYDRQSGWAIGPYCMVIDWWKWLSAPIECKGQLGTWPLNKSTKDLLERRINTDLHGDEASYKYPGNPEALERRREELREQKRRKKRQREEGNVEA